jgi:hypothetical protein
MEFFFWRSDAIIELFAVFLLAFFALWVGLSLLDESLYLLLIVELVVQDLSEDELIKERVISLISLDLLNSLQSIVEVYLASCLFERVVQIRWLLSIGRVLILRLLLVWLLLLGLIVLVLSLFHLLLRVLTALIIMFQYTLHGWVPLLNQ